MAYNAKGEWVDEPNSKSIGQTFFPNAAQAWNDGAGLADASFQRGDTMEGWGRQAARVGGTLAGLSHDVNPVNKVTNWMNQTPAQPGYMKGAVNVGPGVDRSTGQSTWTDSRGAVPEINGQGGYRKMASDLADLSQQRFGGQSADPYGATPDRFSQPDLGNQFMTGSAPGQMPLGREGGFFSGNRAYNVNDTSQAGVSRVTAKGTSPLYTNIAPEEAVAGLKNQMIGGDAADVQQGLDRFARANATWQSVIDKQPQGGVGVMADPADHWNGVMNQMRSSASTSMPSGLSNRQQMQFLLKQQELGQQGEIQRRGQDMSFASQLGQQGVTARGQDIQARGQDLNYRGHMAGVDAQMANARMSAEERRAANQDTLEANRSWRESQVAANESTNALNKERLTQMQSEAAYNKTPHAQFMKEIDALGKIAQNTGDPAVMAMLQERLARLNAARRKSETAAYAEGGKVDPEELMRQMSAKYGALIASQSALQSVQQPRSVQQPVQQPAPQGGLMDRMRAVATGNLEQRMRAAGAYAEGGPVGVGGRQVLGEGDGKSDSLPAVIDGEHPAALSTGEFVMPVEAVQHFGLAKLNKMVEQARKGLDTGR